MGTSEGPRRAEKLHALGQLTLTDIALIMAFLKFFNKAIIIFICISLPPGEGKLEKQLFADMSNYKQNSLMTNKPVCRATG